MKNLKTTLTIIVIAISSLTVVARPPMTYDLVTELGLQNDVSDQEFLDLVNALYEYGLNECPPEYRYKDPQRQYYHNKQERDSMVHDFLKMREIERKKSEAEYWLDQTRGAMIMAE